MYDFVALLSNFRKKPRFLRTCLFPLRTQTWIQIWRQIRIQCFNCFLGNPNLERRISTIWIIEKSREQNGWTLFEHFFLTKLLRYKLVTITSHYWRICSVTEYIANHFSNLSTVACTDNVRCCNFIKEKKCSNRFALGCVLSSKIVWTFLLFSDEVLSAIKWSHL